MSLTLLANLAGGIGLFMLGMMLMTNGLKLSAGNALRNILERSTRTAFRGILSGVFITSLVQSSSAVTVATIGFVNAGLLNLTQAIMLVYGSNVGTTMTGWLVATIGFNVNIKAFSLPAIGIGMMFQLAKTNPRLAALGESLAGFGIFFLGIEIMKTTFAGVGGSIQLESLDYSGATGLLLFSGTGFLLTFFMQSSSAAMAIILTATGGGIIPINVAASMVIGSNLGTTTTAAIASLGATPNAKRVAAGHVIFNLITGLVALAILPALLFSLERLRHVLGMETGHLTLLALFHTTFNILGVLILLPLTVRMVRFLEQRFRISEEDEALPRYLDRNVVSTPTLALQAMAMELGRVGALARRMALGAISSETSASPRLKQESAALDNLVDAIGDFSSSVQRRNLPPQLDDQLPNAMRVSRYYTEIAELVKATTKSQLKGTPISHPVLSEQIANFKGSVAKLLEKADALDEEYSSDDCSERMEAINEEYQELKAVLLRAGTVGEIGVRQMVNRLEMLSDIRRIAEQAEKGARFLSNLKSLTPLSPDEEKEVRAD